MKIRSLISAIMACSILSACSQANPRVEVMPTPTSRLVTTTSVRPSTVSGSASVVYVLRQEDHRGLFQIGSGGAISPVFQDGMTGDRPVISPNARQLYFLRSDSSNLVDLYVYGMDDKLVRPLVTGLSASAGGLAVSSDGSVASLQIQNVEDETWISSTVFVYDSKSGSLLWTIENAMYPAWAPTDNRLAYVGMTAQGGHIYVRSADGTIHNMTPDTSVGSTTIHWSTDGALVYFTNEDELARRHNIYAVSRDGGSPFQLSEGVDVMPPLAVDPFGKAMVFAAREDDASPAYLFSLATRKLQKLGLPFGFYSDPSWSPDGSRVVFSFRSLDQDALRSGLVVIEPGTGRYDQLVIDEPGTVSAWPFWLENR